MLSYGHSWQNSIAEAHPAQNLGKRAGVMHVVREEGGGGAGTCVLIMINRLGLPLCYKRMTAGGPPVEAQIPQQNRCRHSFPAVPPLPAACALDSTCHSHPLLLQHLLPPPPQIHSLQSQLPRCRHGLQGGPANPDITCHRACLPVLIHLSACVFVDHTLSKHGLQLCQGCAVPSMLRDGPPVGCSDQWPMSIIAELQQHSCWEASTQSPAHHQSTRKLVQVKKVSARQVPLYVQQHDHTDYNKTLYKHLCPLPFGQII